MSEWTESLGRQSLMLYFSHEFGEKPILYADTAGAFDDKKVYSALSKALGAALGKGKFLVIDQKKLVDLPDDASFVFDEVTAGECLDCMKKIYDNSDFTMHGIRVLPVRYDKSVVPGYMVEGMTGRPGSMVPTFSMHLYSL